MHCCCIIFLIFISFINIAGAQVADSSRVVVSDSLSIANEHVDMQSVTASPPETVKDTINIYPDWAPDPKKATLWALIPGGGQVYNWVHHDKWWLASLKLAVIYGGFGTLSYFIVQNANDYKDYRDAYKWVSSKGVSGKENQYTSGLTESQLESLMNYYLSNVEWCGFFTVLLYGLQIMEATVTAHLLTFDISEDLSLGLKPISLNLPKQPMLPQTFGLSMRYKINYK